MNPLIKTFCSVASKDGLIQRVRRLRGSSPRLARSLSTDRKVLGTPQWHSCFSRLPGTLSLRLEGSNPVLSTTPTRRRHHAHEARSASRGSNSRGYYRSTHRCSFAKASGVWTSMASRHGVAKPTLDARFRMGRSSRLAHR